MTGEENNPRRYPNRTLGILCYWIRGNFWVTAVIAYCVQVLCAAVVYIRDVVVAANYAPNSAGMTLPMAILEPVILIALLVYYLHVNKQEEHKRSHSGDPMGQVG